MTKAASRLFDMNSSLGFCFVDSICSEEVLYIVFFIIIWYGIELNTDDKPMLINKHGVSQFSFSRWFSSIIWIASASNISECNWTHRITVAKSSSSSFDNKYHYFQPREQREEIRSQHLTNISKGWSILRKILRRNYQLFQQLWESISRLCSQ